MDLYSITTKYKQTLNKEQEAQAIKDALALRDRLRDLVIAPVTSEVEQLSLFGQAAIKKQPRLLSSLFTPENLAKLPNDAAKIKGIKAREALILNHLRLIVAECQRVAAINPSLVIDDLFSHGFMGLCHALEKYDLDAGTKFTSYAVFWIKCRIQEAIKAADVIKHPQKLDKGVGKYVVIAVAPKASGEREDILECFTAEDDSSILDEIRELVTQEDWDFLINYQKNPILRTKEDVVLYNRLISCLRDELVG